jgi:hypothetical protein
MNLVPVDTALAVIIRLNIQPEDRDSTFTRNVDTDYYTRCKNPEDYRFKSVRILFFIGISVTTLNSMGYEVLTAV